MPPKSLSEMANAILFKNLSSIASVGYLSYASVRHLLVKIEDARQLRLIELNCPQLQRDTGELWLKLIEKDFPLEFKANAYKPKNPDRWFKVWEKYKAERDRSLHKSEEQLRSAFMGLREDKAKKTSTIVEGRFLPSDAVRPKKRNMGPKDTSTSVLSFGGGSRTKMRTGADVMRKARREAREVRNIQGTLSRSVVAPIRLLEKQHLPTAAPAAMVHEQRIAAQPAFRTPEAEQREQRRQEMERKRAATLEEHAQKASYITDSEDDSDAPTQPVRKPSSKRPAPAAAAITTTASSSSAPPPPPTKTLAPGRKVLGSGCSMFQRKFGQGKSSAMSSPKPVRIISAAAASPPSAKKRSRSEANLGDEPQRPVTPSKPPAIQVALLSPNHSLPKVPSPEMGKIMSHGQLPEQAKVLPRKKKPVNVFMKRPVRRT
ncbi:RNA polymerase II transcription factor SIII (Elongin) subunit A [Cordyceps militaris CM01]|uniref:RNA polymerase II transcription factor SIII (Elongin) subunit A n=1 Tax=Cordyceps militaris (strain CM01) TaxID=983644 RepID=G3JL80_CORMM|nr:RNA polymerase II transcription factor SIII (Elongin) subunit A [Cordyceps militaris CM01]EGX90454.1 RNA polymerase II transcription factor SIII (Elongin) subunit A [Cordyceps militaris CM01]